jgi:hypothetical protein
LFRKGRISKGAALPELVVTLKASPSFLFYFILLLISFSFNSITGINHGLVERVKKKTKVYQSSKATVRMRKGRGKKRLLFHEMKTQVRRRGEGKQGCFIVTKGGRARKGNMRRVGEALAGHSVRIHDGQKLLKGSAF